MSYQTIESRSDAGLNRFYAKIYGLVGMGIALSALISFLMLTVFVQNTISLLQSPMMIYIALIAEIAVVFMAAPAAAKNSPVALPLFLIYSALNGFTLTFVILGYTAQTVLSAFISSAVLFFVMSAVGVMIKRDLSGMAKALIAGVIGILIASVVNLFMGSSALAYLISIVTVIIFSGLIAYDNQVIKKVYYQSGGVTTDGWAISMALNLYIDFINIFLSLLRIFGNRN